MRHLAALPLLLLVPACEPAEEPFEAPPPLTGEVGGMEAEADTAAARAAVLQFHDALTRGDSARVLELLHPDATIYEAGHAETVAEYRAGHLAADIEFAAGVEREILQEEAVSLGEAVLYVAEARARGSFRDRDIDAHGVETMVLASVDGQWRIRHVHWSSR